MAPDEAKPNIQTQELQQKLCNIVDLGQPEPISCLVTILEAQYVVADQMLPA